MSKSLRVKETDGDIALGQMVSSNEAHCRRAGSIFYPATENAESATAMPSLIRCALTVAIILGLLPAAARAGR